MPTVENAARRAWHLLPTSVRNSQVAAHAKHAVLGRVPGQEAPPIPRVVRTLAELDEMLGELDVAAALSDDALRRGFTSFKMKPPRKMPSDPWSDSYRRAVLDLYEWLHGSPYAPTNELTRFDLARAIDAPFPYATKSACIVGEHLMAVGHLVRTLDLPAGSDVLELGPGWGNVTLALAQMGHRVTAVDVSPDFVELVKARAERVHADIETMLGDFGVVHELTGRYDAVVFFECFHHSADHLDLLAGLDRIVRPGGRVLFAAEPIYSSFPMPWGLRLDGEALWAIRRNGWLELGFRRAYFLAALERNGWRARRVDCPETRWGEILVATRR